MRRPALFAVLAVASALAFVACGGDEAPSAPTPSPTPTPAPAPTPAPTPTPFACPLPASSNPTNNCGVQTSRLSEQVNASIDAVMRNYPDLFNFNDLNGGNPKVLDPTRYYTELKKELGALGVCTNLLPEEISVKNNNAFSEDWGVLTSSNFVRRRYRGTCSPAWW